MSSNQKQIIEQAKCTYYPFKEAFEKQTKTSEDQQKSQISAIYESAKHDFNIDRSGASHEKQKEVFNRFVNERALQYTDIKDKIDPKKLVYKFSRSENLPKGFGNYQMPLKLLGDLRDGIYII